MVVLRIVPGFEVAGTLIEALDPEQRAHSFVEGELVDDHVKDTAVRGFLNWLILRKLCVTSLTRVAPGAACCEACDQVRAGAFKSSTTLTIKSMQTPHIESIQDWRKPMSILSLEAPRHFAR